MFPDVIKDNCKQSLSSWFQSNHYMH